MLPTPIRLALLQFHPKFKDVAHNTSRADELLEEAGLTAGQVDLLILPEMIFTGEPHVRGSSYLDFQ